MQSQSTASRDVDILQNTLSDLSHTYNGFSGNCAQVAMVLDEVLDTGGDYVVVSGEHYEYADHVFVRWSGLLWDMNGGQSPADAQESWCAVEDDDEAPELEDFPDPSNSSISQMADDTNVLSGGFDRADFKRDLLSKLSELGFGSLSEEAQSALELSEPTIAHAPKPKF